MSLKSKKAAIEKTSGKSLQTNAAELSQEQPTTRRPDGTTSEIASGVAGTEATTTTSQSITVTKKNSVPTALAIWDIVPDSQMPDLTTLSFDDLLLVAKKAWRFGRIAHDVVVVIFQEIMNHYDGRKSTRPPMKVEEAFASIGANYEAARKMVYRDRKKRKLEAIAASLHLLPATKPTTSIFNIGDGVTIAHGDGVIEHVHQTTGKIDVFLAEGEETVSNVNPKDVTALNGVAVINGKVAKQKEHVLITGELLIDAATGKKWTFADGEFLMTKTPTRKEIKQDAIAQLKVKREAARLRKEEEKKELKAEAARKDLAKIEAAKAKREAARLRKEEAKRARKAEAALKKLAKVEAAKAKREAKCSAKAGRQKTNGTLSQSHRSFQWNLIKGSTDSKPYAVSNNKGEILSRYATEPEAASEVERLTTKYQAPASDVVAGAHIAATPLAEKAIVVDAPGGSLQPEPLVATV